MVVFLEFIFIKYHLVFPNLYTRHYNGIFYNDQNMKRGGYLLSI